MAAITHNDADVQFSAARTLWQQNRVAEAEAALRQLVQLRPQGEDAAMLLAEVLRGQGRLNASCHAAFALCRARDFDGEISFRGARFIQECQRQPLADEICDAVIGRGRASPALLALSGNIARELGNFEKARARYLAALDAGVALDSWHVLGALAHTRRYTDSNDPDFVRFMAHFENAAVPARARAATGFGLAKARDDLGDFARAATVLHEANAQVREVLPWNAAAWRDFVETRKKERVARLQGSAPAAFVPVFVVGLPRSGTTLTAAQLAASTGARDRGEMRTLRFIADTLIGGRHFGSPAAVAEAAQLYVNHSRQDDAPATWYIDQDPLNFRYLHLIDAMFPQARVIVCRRNRRDTALSLWGQDFAHPDCAFAYDFDAIGGYIDGFESLVRHWRETLAVPIMGMDYEELVADPRSTLRRLRGFIGASETEAPHAAAPIATASVWQARQPIYGTSVGRWRRYLPFLPELERIPAGAAG